MIKKTLFLFFILIFLTPKHSYALEYYNFLYTVEQGDDFTEILRKFVKDESIINADTPLVQKIMNSNKKVRDWKNLNPGTPIELFIQEEFFDKKKYEKYSDLVDKKLAAQFEQKIEPSKKTDYFLGLKGSVFYMASQGLFSQKSSQVADLEFSQNTPITAGVSLTYYPKNSLYSYAVSSYFAYLLPSTNNLTSESTKIPPEIGFNTFGEYRFVRQNFTLYGGPDIERYSTFNMDGLSNDQKIYVDQNVAVYATFGISKAFTIFDKQIFTKTSISKSVVTKYTSALPSTVNYSTTSNSSYDGYKLMMYINYKFSNKFYFHSLIKYHTMNGPSNLTTLRIGIGFGYILF
jgi:hypothetical protein